MSERITTFSIPADASGYVSFNCPYCGQRFKLDAAEVQAEDVIDLWCPACGLPGNPSSFIFEDARKAAQIIAENMVREMINDFGKQIERQFRGSQFIKVQRGRELRSEPDKIIIEQDDLQVLRLTCCDRTVKTRALEAAIGYYCPYCGGRR